MMMAPAEVDHRPLLLVEDDADVRDAIAATLRDEGYVVAEAENGRLALEWLQRNGDPCLVLLDLWMPVMSGMELRERMVQDPRLAALPLVVVSAAGDGKARAEEMGAIGYLRKPLDLQDLLATVERYC
ncbi:MAG: response regulator [Deltaproteobacteria bacterium]|nr:MAG: response regulator [Deltaproteobacteria bacterium]TMB34714.1 MAG: response regulator [Deltaproteobacteria bacterium]